MGEKKKKCKHKKTEPIVIFGQPADYCVKCGVIWQILDPPKEA